MDIVILSLFFIITAFMFSLLENKFPIRIINRKNFLGLNISLTLFSLSISGLILNLINYIFSPFDNLRPSWSYNNKLVIFVYFFVITDFLKYICHVLMHKSYFWKMHLLHHMPKQLHWLSGNRASLLMLIFHFGPIGITGWFLNIAPELILINSLINIIWNHLMHTNTKLNSKMSRFLEYLLVTPDYHQIHHSSQVEFHNMNFGSVLTIWDRFFKTYLSPKNIDIKSIKLGVDAPLNEKINWKILLGI